MSFQQVAGPPPSAPVDLDAVERLAAQSVPGSRVAAYLRAMAAELRPAREVVAEGRDAAELLGHPESYNLEEAIKRYDRAVGQ